MQQTDANSKYDANWIFINQLKMETENDIFNLISISKQSTLDS